MAEKLNAWGVAQHTHLLLAHVIDSGQPLPSFGGLAIVIDDQHFIVRVACLLQQRLDTAPANIGS